MRPGRVEGCNTPAMAIYTGQGDDGTSAGADGVRRGKSEPLFAALGAVDECAVALGAVRAQPGLAAPARARLGEIQDELLTLGAALGGAPVHGADFAVWTSDLESWCDALTGESPPLANFIRPAGSPLSLAAHGARVVVRRAERALCAPPIRPHLPPGALAYVNRLGDLCFALARAANYHAGVDDEVWRG